MLDQELPADQPVTQSSPSQSVCNGNATGSSSTTSHNDSESSSLPSTSGTSLPSTASQASGTHGMTTPVTGRVCHRIRRGSAAPWTVLTSAGTLLSILHRQ